MVRAPCCSKVGLMRGPWSAKEDALLTEYIQQNGEGQWRSLPKKAGLLRCGKSCRLRWMNYLRPGIKRGNISEDEEDLIVRLHGLLGNRWSLIAGRLPGRTDNEIKNYWNTCLLKKLPNSEIIGDDNSTNPNSLRKDLPRRPSKKSSKKKNINVVADKPGKDPKKQNKLVPDRNNKSSRTDEDVVVKTDNGQEKLNNDDKNKVKVYLPKPVRLSSVFPRTGSVDNLAPVSRNAGAGDAVPPAMSWQPEVFAAGGVGDYYDGLCDGDGNDGFLMPLLQSSGSSMSSEDVDMMYDEFLHLLQNM